MKKILITGGAGNIGASLADKLSQNKENSIFIIDNLITGKIENIPANQNIKFYKCDVNKFNDIAPIMISNNFDYVFHFAALVGVKRTIENPLMVFDDIDGIKNILMLSKNTNVKKVFYSSSSEVYGEPFEIPQNEESTPLNSRLPYAIVKNLGESLFRTYYKEFGLEYTIFRFFNTYGPRQSNDFVISKFINLALNNKDITINGSGSQTRTFCYIDDNLDTIINILNSEQYNDEVINIGNEDEITIIDLAKLIIETLVSSSKIVHLSPLKEGDMTRRKPDVSKMKKILNRDLTVLRDGIIKCVKNGNYEKK
jgi:UDP-glucose 4-epimerase